MISGDRGRVICEESACCDSGNDSVPADVRGASMEGWDTFDLCEASGPFIFDLPFFGD